MTAKSMRSRRSAGLFLAASCLMLACVGCINYEEEISLDKDGSGTIRIEYTVSDKFAAIAEQAEKEAKDDQKGQGLPFSAEQAQRAFDIEKVLTPTAAPVFAKSAGYRTTTIVCEFDDINHEDFPAIPLFEGGKITFKEDDKKNLVFTRVLRAHVEEEKEGAEGEKKDAKPKPASAATSDEKGPEISLDEDASDAGDTLAKSVFAEYKLKFVVHFPGRILKTNGAFYEEGEQPGSFEWLYLWFRGHRKAVWEFRLADIAKKGALTATISNRWPIEWIIIIAIILVALGLIVLKSKPGVAEAESEAVKAEAAEAEENEKGDAKE